VAAVPYSGRVTQPLPPEKEQLRVQSDEDLPELAVFQDEPFAPE
jgi:hypothetical protein